jgi:hypothetical protein
MGPRLLSREKQSQAADYLVGTICINSLGIYETLC